MTLCVLGCSDPGTGQAWPAEPGWFACPRCADRLGVLLADVFERAAVLTDPEELPPGGDATTRGAPGYGSRSPARDDLLAHGDVRTKWTEDAGYGALAVLHSWARILREDHDAATPDGPATLSSEYGTLRWHWLKILGALWLDEFADELHELHAQLCAADARDRPRTWRVGPCPNVLQRYRTQLGQLVTIECGATLRLRLGSDTITCRACNTSWPRERWIKALGDPWVDYAALSEMLGVPVGTLWRWRNEDQWRTSGTRARRLVHRDDALHSYDRRHKSLEQAG